MVPLRLVSDKTEQNIIFWQNERPSSTRYCRPIRFQFAYETTDLSKKERQHIEKQIQLLKSTTYKFNDITIEINYKMLFTMIDGKVCNAITETTSSQKCFICGLTSNDFNNIEKVTHTILFDASRLSFGLSILHAWIRFFECILHVAYKLPLKKWQVRGEGNKEIVVNRKKYIQEKFYREMGTVDKPKPGFGNSNDGNTARRFFRDPEMSALITGVHLELIKRFKIILQAISSGHTINIEKFQNYALTTAKLFLEKYDCYPMPTTVHKILIHGPQVIKYALLPIGQLSEEAQEARNKEFKRYREYFSRKMSRTKTNEDILHLLLITSDPLVTSMRKYQERKEHSLTKMF